MKKTIVIVDDTPTVLKLVSFYIKTDYNVLSFDKSTEAMNYIDSNDAPDLFILDLRMPEISGEEMLKRIRKNNKFQDVPVVILSAEDANDKKDAMLALGANYYIEKPFRPTEIKDLVKSILG